MRQSLDRLTIACANRQRPSAGRRARSSAEEAVRLRNTRLDAVFYDVGIIEAEEAARLGPWAMDEGGYLFVPPTGEGALLACEDLSALAGVAGGRRIALVVAGVGSSALGTAALGRNVADALGLPAVGVVSGYGMADLAAEAVGGWVWFGALNQVRHAFRQVGRLSGIGLDLALPPPDALLGADVLAVRDALADPRLAVAAVVGHSKGSLVIAEALYALDPPTGALPEAGETLIVTLGAVIEMPAVFTRIVDVLGEWDWLGRLNSRPMIPVDLWVPQAMHHTNTEVAAHVPVREIVALAAEISAPA